jgi:hypothetical protein
VLTAVLFTAAAALVLATVDRRPATAGRETVPAATGPGRRLR